MTKLKEVCHALRSKNAGAFTITIDLLAKDEATYHRLVQHADLTPGAIARRYGVARPGDVLVIPYPKANALKITMPRRHPSGDHRDSDVYGAQQHAPLLDIEL